MKILLSLLCVCVLALAVVFHDFFIEYKTVDQSYVVQKNDTLWSIGEKYISQQDKTRHLGEFVFLIRQNNPDKVSNNRMLQPGDVLIIPLEKYKE